MNDPHLGDSFSSDGQWEHDDRWPDGDWREAESMILAAGHYVRPSEDLRPRTLETARELCRDRKAVRKLGGLAIAILMLALISFPASQRVQAWRAKTAAPSSNDMHERAAMYGQQAGIGAHWGMAEAFIQLRRVQASRLGHRDRYFK